MRIRTGLRVLTAYALVAVTFMAFAPAVFGQYECQFASGFTVNGALDAADPDQTTRVFRGGGFLASTCLWNPAPTGAPIAGTFNHDAIPVTNTSPVPGCVTIRLDTACVVATNPIFVVAYSTYNPAAPNTNIIGNLGATPNGTITTPAYFSFPVAAGQNFTIVVSEVASGAGCASYTLTGGLKTGCRQPGFDRDNDGTTDFAVYRPGNPSLWLNKPTAGGTTETRSFGETGDIPAHGDYLGNGFGSASDGLTDLAVYRPSNMRGYAAYSQTNPASNVTNVNWGSPGDIPVPGDYDGDGAHDVAIFRPSTGQYWILQSSTFTTLVLTWGTSGDTPVSGDFDGDSLADVAVVRSDGTLLTWWIMLSNFKYTLGFFRTQWGLATDKVVPGDYDGDGRADMTVWRPSDGTFYQILGAGITGTTRGIKWGQSGDIPQPGDYNNDKIHDAAVYRPSNNTFYALLSGSGTAVVTTLGQAGDEPVSAPYRVQ
jgi:FG-GAP-like repeat